MRHSSVLILDLPGQTEPFVPDSPNAKNAKRDRWDKNCHEEYDNQSFLSFDGEP
jgi:hypothetical protein